MPGVLGRAPQQFGQSEVSIRRREACTDLTGLSAL